MSSNERRSAGAVNPDTSVPSADAPAEQSGSFQRRGTRDAGDVASSDPRVDSDAHRARLLPMPQADFPTNDSFGQPLSQDAIFASTRPFDSPPTSDAVEQFLSQVPVTNTTFTPSASYQRGMGATLPASDVPGLSPLPKAAIISEDPPHRYPAWQTSTASPLAVPTARSETVSVAKNATQKAGSTPSPTLAAVHQDPQRQPPPVLQARTATIASSSSSRLPAALPVASAFTSSSASQPRPQAAQVVVAATESNQQTSRSSTNASTVAAAAAITQTPSLSEKKIHSSSLHGGGPTDRQTTGALSPASSTATERGPGVVPLVSRSSPYRGLAGASPASPAGVSGGASSLQAIASMRPASPSPDSVGRPGSHYSGFTPVTEGVSGVSGGYAGATGGVLPRSPTQRSPTSSNFAALTARQVSHTGGGAAFSNSPSQQQQQQLFSDGGGFSRSRSDTELRRLYGERSGATPQSMGAGQMYRMLSPGSNDFPPVNRPSSSNSSQRQRGVVRASESSLFSGSPQGYSRLTPPGSQLTAGAGGQSPGQPPWMGAVERARESHVSNDPSFFDPVLPYDQSKLGLQTRRAAAQGTLTAGKLRAYEAQKTGEVGGGYGGSPDRGYPSSAIGQGGAFGNVRPGQHSPRSFFPIGNAPMLVAQEEALSTSTRCHARTSSDNSSWRRAGHVRSVAGGFAPGMAGGRHPISATAPLRVLTASETVLGNGGGATAGPGMGGQQSPPGSSPFRSRSPGGNGNGNGITTTFSGMGPKAGSSEQTLVSLVQGKTPHDGTAPLHATEASGGGLATAASNGGNGGSWMGWPPAGGYGRGSVVPGSAAGGGSGNSGKGGNRPHGSSNGVGGSPRTVKSSRSEAGPNRLGKSESGKKAIDMEGDEDERDERHFRTRNINAMHAIPWDQRRQLPMTGFGTRFFALLSTPRFWEKLDWTVRGSLLTVLPTMVLSLEPTTAGQFPMASTLAFNAFWITMPTFGSGLRELIIALKGFSMGLLFLCIIVAAKPGPVWLSLLLLFIFTLVSSFVAEETKKTAAYVLASTIMQYVSDPIGTDFNYVRQYYIALLISLGFGTAAFLVPFIRWSSDIARHYIKALGNSLSIDVQGTLSSFWVRSPLERELNVVRLRQLRATAEKCIGKVETALDESGYEPHTGAYMMCMVNRFNFCKSIHNILGSLSHVIELIADNPTVVDTPMCIAFGERIGDHLAVISSAIDNMVLKIVDFENLVAPRDIQFFCEARACFQDALSRVREEVILTNENYETDESDVLLGFFMFSVDELCEVISQFSETAEPPNTLWNALQFPIRDVKSVIFAFKNLGLTVVRRRTIPRRMKEAIKLSLCMVLPTIFQVYALGNSAVSPMAGAAVIALIYNPTGSESFHYASGRLLGTVLGSMCALLSVQIANGRLWVLYLFIALISFIGAYVQAAPGFYALGNAIVCSTISVCTQYTDQNAAMVRIQQNCFAILMYFAIACVLWPMRAHTKVKMSLNITLRCIREAVTRMLRNLDMPDDAEEIGADVSALLIEMHKKVRAQTRFIPGAVEEPTMGSVEYPEDSWKRIVEAEKKLYLALSMMCFAYRTFMSSRADMATDLSVHWVVLHRIAPHAHDLSDLIFASIDLYLLSLSKTTIVPTTHLTRLRVGMVEAHQAILDTYIATISRKVAGEGDTDEEEVDGRRSEDDGLGDSSYSNGDLCYNPQGNGNGDATNNNATIPANGLVAGIGQGTGDPAAADGPASPQNGPDGRGQRSKSSQRNPRRHGDQESSSGSSAASSDTDGDDDDDDNSSQRNRRRRRRRRHAANGAPETTTAAAGKKKKKVGYLGYNLTKEDAAALRAFLATRSNNGTFGTNRSLVGNNTFAGRTMTGTMSLAAAAAALATGTPMPSAASPQANNNARLMARAGDDDGLAAALRKKHHVVVKRGKDDENGGDESLNTSHHGAGAPEGKKGDGAGPDTALLELPHPNASFLKSNSFLKNTSFLGSLFVRKLKEQRDLDAAEQTELHTTGSQGSHTAHSTPIHSPQRGKRRGAGEPLKEAAHHKNGAKRDKKVSATDEGGADKETAEVEDAEKTSDRSTPVTSPSRHVDASSVPSDVEDDAATRDTHGSRDFSNPRSTTAAVTDSGVRTGRPPPLLAHSVPSVFSPFGDDDGGDPHSRGTALTAQQRPLAHSTPEDVGHGAARRSGEAPVKGREKEKQMDGAASPHSRRDGCGSPGKGTVSHDSTNPTGSTEKKIVTGKDGEGTTHGSSDEKAPHTGSEDDPAKVSKPTAVGNEDASLIEKKDASAPPQPQPQQSGTHGIDVRLGSEFSVLTRDDDGLENGKQDGSEGHNHALGALQPWDRSVTEVLQSLSFFNAEKGEFVLTNHDIHSLEAFLFGIHALVVYINELQKALLEMQHASELARLL